MQADGWCGNLTLPVRLPWVLMEVLRPLLLPRNAGIT